VGVTAQVTQLNFSTAVRKGSRFVCYRESMLLRVILSLALCAPALAQVAELRLTDANGADRSLEELRGKYVVVNFWATWCAPCLEEMPMIVNAEKKYRKRDVVFVAASLDDPTTLRRVPRFLRDQNMEKLTVWLGANEEKMKDLGVGPAVPATVLIDRDGTIVARLLGQMRKKDFIARLEWLTGDRSGPSPAPVVDTTAAKK
jgi:thiol-disulfide isomerase/thioredoxin